MAKILIADDNRANREALGALLESAGYEVLTAPDGGEALELARGARPDLVISDVLMPKMDGYELARRLKSDPATAPTLVMFYTAYFGGRDATELAQAHGVERVLVKPSDNDEILRAVRDALLSSAEATFPGANLDREHLRVMVDQLLEKTGTLEAQQRRIERLNRTLEMLSAVNALIVRGTDRDALLEEACRIAVEKGGFRLAAIGMLEVNGQGGLRQVAAAGEGSAAREFGRIKLSTQALVWNEAGGGSFVALPLVVAGSPSGLLLLYARVHDFFDRDEMRLLHELAGDISFALQHLEQKARMDYLAYHDSLTGLPNRALFTDRMGQALLAARREKRFAAAVFLDIERFRLVNESFGRKAGDDLLRQIALRLRKAAREQDTLARVGGDHFALCVAPFDHPGETVHGIVERIGEAVSQPLVVDGVELRVGVKAGVAIYPTDAETTETLCADAETALRRAKETTQSYLFYAPDMNARVAESLALEHRLRRTLDAGQLGLHYQPKIDVASGRLAGLEALIRWTDPELGAVPPSRFVSLMEETGMILAAGRWALRKAVEDIRHWRSLGLQVPRVAVNVSALQLRQKDFVDSVLDAIQGAGEQPLIDLEITESVLVDDIDESTRKLQILRRTGIEVSVDDFGTGYCSLSYLARLPVDTLKIDRSFVVRMGEKGYPRNIVAMIVSLAHTLGLKVIAEGVEDGEQVRMLRELGCDQIQGFYVSAPVPAEKIEALLHPEVEDRLRQRIAAA